MVTRLACLSVCVEPYSEQIDFLKTDGQTETLALLTINKGRLSALSKVSAWDVSGCTQGFRLNRVSSI